MKEEEEQGTESEDVDETAEEVEKVVEEVAVDEKEREAADG